MKLRKSKKPIYCPHEGEPLETCPHCGKVYCLHCGWKEGEK